MNGKKTTLERLAIIDTEIGHIKVFMEDIMNNHLKSIYKKLDRLPTWATIIITLLSSLTTGLIIYGVMRKI